MAYLYVYMPQLPFYGLLIASALAGALSASVLVANLSGVPTAISLTPGGGTVSVAATFTVHVQISSEIPVNVFQGLIAFDSTRLQVERIDYNTSIATLWAEEPWYENGDGTISFIGGTTIAGGFVGTGDLITITFRSTRPGTAAVTLRETRVLKHDGLGTDAAVTTPIDALFTVGLEALDRDTVTQSHGDDAGPTIDILPLGRSTDLNGDGLQTIVDVSIFMRHLTSQNSRSDFNGDGLVSTKDLSIILNQ